MSSLYRVLCLSHDPALYVDQAEWATHTQLEAALANVDKAPELEEHRHCDLMGGRYSYPLVEVYCPPVRDEHRHYPWHPRTGEWISADWLRLLYAAQVAKSDEKIRAAIKGVPGCWSWQRLDRLAPELGVAS